MWDKDGEGGREQREGRTRPIGDRLRDSLTRMDLAFEMDRGWMHVVVVVTVGVATRTGAEAGMSASWRGSMWIGWCLGDELGEVMKGSCGDSRSMSYTKS